jgi:pyruvate-ferredoxin/flavodoxin oxidoreductase
VPDIVADYMKKVSALTGRKYNLFDYVGDPNADRVIISMGSSCETIEEVVDHLNARGESVGLVKVRLFRPFSAKAPAVGHPGTAKPGSPCSTAPRSPAPWAIRCTRMSARPSWSRVKCPHRQRPLWTGLQGVQPLHGQGGVRQHERHGAQKPLHRGHHRRCHPHQPGGGDRFGRGARRHGQCKFWGLGADGTVGANKSAIKIIGDNTDMYAQAYFAYDSKKSGGVTISHLRFGKTPIKSTYLIDSADYIACHNPAYVHIYDVLEGIKDGGTFMLNSPWSLAEMEAKLPGHAPHHRPQKAQILQHRCGQDCR